MHRLSYLLFGFLSILACEHHAHESPSATTLFNSLSAERTGISFANAIVENDTLNYYTFPYLYMGGGVSIGDINNDGLEDVFLTGNMVPNCLYLNQGNLQFLDITDYAGIAGDERWYSGSTMIDINLDGWLDIYVCVSGQKSTLRNQLYINNQDNTFSEQAAAYHIDDSTASIQATFLDYDNDTDLDLFVINYPQIKVSLGNQYYYDKMQANRLDESAHLYRNNGGGSFTEVTTEAGLRNFGLSLGVVAADFNRDGHSDLYVSNDFNVPDYFYLNQGDGTFTESLRESFRHTSMFGMGVDAADFNNDGWLDLAQVDMTPEDHKRAKTNMASMQPAAFQEAVEMGFHYQYMQNSLQLNNGVTVNGKPLFSNVARISGMATTDWSWGVQFADLDNSGEKDIFISNGMKRDVNNNDANARFMAESFFSELRPKYSELPSVPISNYVYQNNEAAFLFDKMTAQWGLDQPRFTNGFAFADLDNDGDLDAVWNNLDAPAMLLENRSIDAKYLQIKCKGPIANPLGIGTKVSIQTASRSQHQELTLTRGFQSSVPPMLHFGLGSDDSVRELRVTWPDKRVQTIPDIAANQKITLKYSSARAPVKSQESGDPFFQKIEPWAAQEFVHQEDTYDDFLTEPLLPHRNSTWGPPLTVGDINGDKLADFFVGNAAGNRGALFIQTSTGQFQRTYGPWEADSVYEDTGALMFDPDGDGDQDLYVVSGGNNASLPPSQYQDRLYLNVNGHFTKSTHTLPELSGSGKAICTADFDDDGDLDLFVGGRIIPGKYPQPAPSFLLENQGGSDLDLRFLDATEQTVPTLSEAGLVTDAAWVDFNQDEQIDLVIAGEWMPIRFFENTGNFLLEVTEDLLNFENHTGWWYSLEPVDIDLDGDIDIVAGNLGLNYKYRASRDDPFQVFSNDFDENGNLDIVLSYEKNDVLLPLRGRECSSQQIPALASRFKTFESFANADLPELYGDKMLEAALHLEAQTFASAWFENKGDSGFEMHPLPAAAQLSAIHAIEVINYNDDNIPDLLLLGNLYSSEVETPRNDASIGTMLVGMEGGTFTVVPATESGLMVVGNASSSAQLKTIDPEVRLLLAGINNESLQILQMKKE